MSTIKDLKPTRVWEIFDQINKVPRPSKKEGKIREFLVDFAKKHNLECKTDKIGNVAMFRPAAPGLEKVKKVVLQAHMDMVCEKNSNSNQNFDTDPIETIIDGEWVHANNTTLGADDGMGVAGALAILTDPSLKLGPVQGFFTVDEETGLTGAHNVGEGMLSGAYLLNLDSEEDGVITMGCAGGIDTTATFAYKPEAAPKDYKYFKINLTKLLGGHSGSDIDAGRACATKLLARVLWRIQKKVSCVLATIDAGNLRNAISHDAYAVIGVKDADKEALAVEFNTFVAEVKNEYRLNEKEMEVTIESVAAPAHIIEPAVARNLVTSCYCAPHGVVSMSLDIKDLVECSTNLASIKMKDDNTIVVTTSQRSAVESRKYDIAYQVEAVFSLAGAVVAHGEGYQGWAPNLDNKILKTAVKVYKDLYGYEPVTNAIHAGLECGLFLKVCPDMEMISYGPTLENVHSPKERVHIPAVQKFYDFTVGILKAVVAEK
jgi:dipeptidase D